MKTKQRVVVFLPPAAVNACDLAAEKYGSSRSEVVRLAVAEGLAGAVESLERLREVRLVQATGAGASRVWNARGAARRSGAAGAEPPDPDRAVSALFEYGRAARAADGDMDSQQLAWMTGIGGWVRLDVLLGAGVFVPRFARGLPRWVPHGADCSNWCCRY